MKHRPHCTLCHAVWILGIGVAASVAAQTSTRARLLVEAAPECATEAAVAARVRARSPQLSFDGGVADPQLMAAVTRAPDGRVSASLTLRSGDRRSERRLEAASCAEAVDALALLIALALDPSAVERPEQPALEVESEPAVAPDAPRAPRTTRERAAPARATARREAEAAPQPSAAEDTAPGPAPPEPAQTPEEPSSEPDAEVNPASASEPLELSFAASLDARGLLGPAPGLLPGIGVSVLVGWERDSVWSPALGLAASHSWLNGVEETGGQASFQLQLVRLDACVLRVRLGPAAVRGCGSGSLGSLAARGSVTYDPKTHSRVLALFGGTLLAEVELGAYVTLRAAAGLAGPLHRHAFRFRPDDAFYRVSALVLDIGLGAGVRFP